MSQSSPKAIGIGSHEGVLEASAELSSAALEEQAVLEVASRNLGGELARDELDDAHGNRGHFTRVGEDAGREDRRGAAVASRHLGSSVSDDGAVLEHLDLGVGRDTRGGRLGHRVEGNVASSNFLGVVKAGGEASNCGNLRGGGGVHSADVKPEEMVGKLDDTVDTEAFELGGGIGEDGSSALLSRDTGGRVVGGRGVVNGRDEGSRSSQVGRGTALGKEDPGKLAILFTHHQVGGGIDINLGTSLKGKGGVYLVDALVGSMAETEARGARNAVATIGEDEGDIGMVAGADIEATRARVAGGRGTPGTEEG